MGGLIMKNLIRLIAVLTPALVCAEPSSKLAWTAEQLSLVESGNPQKGRELAQACAACHGEQGISAVPTYPSLAGQLPTYLFKQLQDYCDGSRQNPLMNGIAKGLTPRDAADLAAWFSTRPAAILSANAKDAYPTAENLVKRGDKQRLLPPCEVCHGTDGKGQAQDVPALSGQSGDYLAASLRAFKSGERHNDIYARMRILAETLSDSEIEALGLYYQNSQQ